MKSVGGAGLIVIGFLFLYLAITGRLDCFFTFVSCVTGAGNPTGTASTGGGGNGINWGEVIHTGIDIYKGGSSKQVTTSGSTLIPLQHL
jgi:hypothetical protein